MYVESFDDILDDKVGSEGRADKVAQPVSGQVSTGEEGRGYVTGHNKRCADGGCLVPDAGHKYVSILRRGGLAYVLSSS